MWALPWDTPNPLEWCHVGEDPPKCALPRDGLRRPQVLKTFHLKKANKQGDKSQRPHPPFSCHTHQSQHQRPETAIYPRNTYNCQALELERLSSLPVLRTQWPVGPWTCMFLWALGTTKGTDGEAGNRGQWGLTVQQSGSTRTRSSHRNVT